MVTKYETTRTSLNNSKMDLLNNLYKTHAPTGSERDIICMIREYVAENVPTAEVQMDRLGNLYITKGEPDNGYPTLACHMDQVQVLHSPDFEVREEDGMLYGWSEANQRREGLGADDKNGIWVCLRCLEECPRLKVFIAVGEEKGCIGSNRADMSFFSDSLYILEPDCKGGEEIHTILRGMPCASIDFEKALSEGNYQYSFTEGKTSDILALTLNGIGVSCANIPAGYHLPHKDDEYTLMSELLRCLDFVRSFVNKHKQRFPFSYKSPTQEWAEEQLRMDCK